jgi:hypothetical protein
MLGACHTQNTPLFASNKISHEIQVSPKFADQNELKGPIKKGSYQSSVADW